MAKRGKLTEPPPFRAQGPDHSISASINTVGSAQLFGFFLTADSPRIPPSIGSGLEEHVPLLLESKQSWQAEARKKANDGRRRWIVLREENH